MSGNEVRLIALEGIPEIAPGDDLAAAIAEGLAATGEQVLPGDVLVVTQKIVSKAEGRLVRLADIAPSPLAQQYAEAWGKDARQVEVTLRESKSIIRMHRGIIISETEHGFICANAGVDASNVAAGTLCLLPVDPDASASRLRDGLAARLGLDDAAAPGIVITDSWGRPWRNGIVNFAIGVAGLAPLLDYRGQHDAAGYELHVTVLAVADELAAAAELVMHKIAARPVVLVRGYEPSFEAPHGRGRDLVRNAAEDLFR